MAYDERGMVLQNYSEIQKDIQDTQRELIPTPLDYTDSKIIYQLNSVVTRSIDQVSQKTQASFSTLALSKAEGVWLDELALLRFVARLGATASFTINQAVYLNPSIIIPSGSLFSSSSTTYTASNSTAITGDLENSYQSIVAISSEVSTDADGTVYSVIVDGVTYSYTKLPADTNLQVLNGLEAAFVADTGKTWSVTTDTDAVTYTLTPLAPNTVAFSSLNTRVVANSVKVFGRVDLTQTGAITVPVGAIDGLSLPVLGFISTTNESAFTVGRIAETDDELRNRIAIGPVSTTTGTLLGIENYVLTNVDGVSFVKALENVTLYPTDLAGRRYGDVELLVLGGTDQDVAEAYERVRDAGQPMFGNVVENITDDEGNSRIVLFSRPTTLNIAYKVEYMVYTEEDLPDDAVQGIVDAVLIEGNSLGLGEDVITSRFYGPIYTAVPTGVGRIQVFQQTLASSGDVPNPANWTEVTLAVDITQIASTAEQDIYPVLIP